MPDTILLTGATGFVGHHLLPPLLQEGHRVRAMSRCPAHKTDLLPHQNLEVVQADLLDEDSLRGALEGVDTAYYLIHSLGGGVGHEKDFVFTDRNAAQNFAAQAERAGIKQTVYLSGLLPPDQASPHLASRREVERVLSTSEVPLTVLRAGFIIGDESAGCIMLDALTRSLDTLLVVPEFYSVTQPAYIDDVVNALLCCLHRRDEVVAKTLEVGSEEQVSYRELIELYAQAADRKLDFVDVPWAPRSLGAAFISAISELPYGLIRALSEGLTTNLLIETDLVVQDESLYEMCPLARTAPEEAIRRAVASRLAKEWEAPKALFRNRRPNKRPTP